MWISRLGCSRRRVMGCRRENRGPRWGRILHCIKGRFQWKGVKSELQSRPARPSPRPLRPRSAKPSGSAPRPISSASAPRSCRRAAARASAVVATAVLNTQCAGSVSPAPSVPPLRRGGAGQRRVNQNVLPGDGPPLAPLPPVWTLSSRSLAPSVSQLCKNVGYFADREPRGAWDRSIRTR
jgi:hypothetical protein